MRRVLRGRQPLCGIGVTSEIDFTFNPSCPKERIALADYHRIESGIDCIYVETTQEDNRKERYWIGVSTGLLVAAEILLDENSIYWMEAAEPEEPPSDAFTLPDGTVLSSYP